MLNPPCLSEHDSCTIYRVPIRSGGVSRVCCRARLDYDWHRISMERLSAACGELAARREGWENITTIRK